MQAMTHAAITEAEGTMRSGPKRRAILEAGADLFLQAGYSGTSMDDVAARAAVSKQTVYAQFGSKEALFVAIVGTMTGDAGNEVQQEIGALGEEDDVRIALLGYAQRQLRVVLTPRLMQLRRLVISESTRFPDLGTALHRGGPQRAIGGLADAFARWTERGLLGIADPATAASQYNWLVMGEPVNRAMLLGDEAIPSPAELHRHAEEAVRAFLAIYPPTGAGAAQAASARQDKDPT